MKKPVLLKQFEYSILPSVFALAGAKKKCTVAEHLPLMKVAIDFENGNLKLEGDWHFMMVSNKHNEPNWYNYHKGRVQIETAIYDSFTINLADPGNDGLVFPLDGTIKEGGFLGSCSGLLVLDNVRGLNGLISDQWNISFYLYDLQFNDCEIKFKLPVYIANNDGMNN
jgi:hypothetical protein